jgi:hypothetical protein
MRGIAAVLTVCMSVAGCTSWSDLRQAGSGEGLEGLPALTPGALDGPTVKVSVERSNLWPIVVSVRPARPAPRNDARPWVQHELVFENTGDRAVRFADTRTSAFIGPSGHRRRLLAADEGCGYGLETRTSPIEARVCLLYLDAFEVKPHASVSRTATLFKGLRGMEPLTAGTYIFERVIRFRVGHEIPDEGTGRTAVLRLVYEIEAAATYWPSPSRMKNHQLPSARMPRLGPV